MSQKRWVGSIHLKQFVARKKGASTLNSLYKRASSSDKRHFCRAEEAYAQ